jgi:hypothetical protein
MVAPNRPSSNPNDRVDPQQLSEEQIKQAQWVEVGNHELAA